MIEVDRRLWLTKDGRLVEDGDPDAAFLWATPGDEVADDDAEKAGYKAASKPSNKQAARPADKSAAPEADKPVDVEQYHTGKGWYEVPGIDKKLRRDEALAALGEE